MLHQPPSNSMDAKQFPQISYGALVTRSDETIWNHSIIMISHFTYGNLSFFSAISCATSFASLLNISDSSVSYRKIRGSPWPELDLATSIMFVYFLSMPITILELYIFCVILGTVMVCLLGKLLIGCTESSLHRLRNASNCNKVFISIRQSTALIGLVAIYPTS